jgi:hypothetical protein
MSNVGWDLDGGSNSGGTKAEFTKFPVGATRIRVLDPAPHIRWTHWMQKHKRSINCPGMKVCPIDDIIAKQKANGETPSYPRGRRYAMNIFNYETNRVEIMEQGKTFMEDLKMIMEDLMDDGKSLIDVELKVRRTGTGKDDTKYRIDRAGDAQGNPPVEGIIDLDEYFKPHTPEQITRLLNGEEWEDVMKVEQEETTTFEDEEIEVN